MAFDFLEHDHDSLILEHDSLFCPVKVWTWEKFYHTNRNFIKSSTFMGYKWWSNYTIF